MLPKKMKAAVVKDFGKPLVIEEMPLRAPKPNEVVMKVVASGVCHTDLHAAEGDWPIKPKLPLVPGHEGVGHVVALGKDVKNLKEGDAIGIPWLYSACGHCEFCITGRENLCLSQQNCGYSVNGGYAEYAIANPNYIGKLPSNVNFLEIAPILCAGVTVYKGLKSTDTKPGEWVTIFGIGGLGHTAVQYAKAMGRKVAAVDIAQDKLDLAKDSGADITINGKEQNPGEILKKEIGGSHGVLVTAVSRIAFEQAIDCVRRGGTVSLNGLPPGKMAISIFDTILNGITIRGSIVGTRKDLQEAIDFSTDKKVGVHYKTEKMENINKVFDDMKKGKISGRIVLDLN